MANEINIEELAKLVKIELNKPSSKKLSKLQYCNGPQKGLNHVKKELTIRSIKLLNMLYATYLYGVVALFLVIGLDKYVYPKITFDKNNEDKDKNRGVLFAEILFLIAFNAIIAYITRNVLQLFPFPFNRVCGFEPMKVNEIRSGAVIGMILLYFSRTIKTKMLLLQSKF